MLSCSLRKFLFGIVLLSIPTYTWSSLIITWFKLRKKWKESEIFEKRHNCVVMFNCERGLSGYPYWKESKTNISANFCEPILYFLRTATKSIDVAVMTMYSDLIIDELLIAHKRGIKIRILVDFAYNRTALKKLESGGVSVLYYVSPFDDNTRSIMHYKYAVKDYSEGKGYMCLGSVNWVTSSFQRNYEDLIFTSDCTMIEHFHNNFEESWNLIRAMQEDNITYH